MTGSSVARRYASALYSVASRLGDTDRIGEDLALVGSTIRGSKELRQALRQPTLGDSARKRVLEKLFGDRVQHATLQFLNLVIEKRRPDVLDTVHSHYVRIADEKRNIQRAQVTSAVPLTEQELAQARETVRKMTGKQVALDTEIDPSIIGGVVLKIGDRVLDGSVRGQLRQLHKAMTGA